MRSLETKMSRGQLLRYDHREDAHGHEGASAMTEASVLVNDQGGIELGFEAMRREGCGRDARPTRAGFPTDSTAVVRPFAQDGRGGAAAIALAGVLIGSIGSPSALAEGE